MAGNTYVTKGYSSYNNNPPRQVGYDLGLQHPVKPYVVETKTSERPRAPASRYTNFYLTPTTQELLREYVYAPNISNTYAPTNHYKSYVPSYGSNYKNSSPNKHLFSSPPHGYPSQETNLVQLGLAEAKHVGLKNFSSPSRGFLLQQPNRVPPEAKQFGTNNISSPAGGYPSQEPNPVQPGLAEVKHVGTNTISSPARVYPSQEPRRVQPKAKHFETNHISSPTSGYPSEDPNPVLQGLAEAKHIGTKDVSGTNWQSASPPEKEHPLKPSTNKITEALGYSEESVNRSSGLDPIKSKVLNGITTRAGTLETQSQYERLAFLNKPTNALRNLANTTN